ncbi:uncharacterized protein C5L36_0C06685 [Pichia kudriavzevii]|uniref:Uncharacterized protein n=1 Tax=Pichia kudriavzevii TaxID=4909 RepID=A0A2U9R6Z5_PICKU|nr:uncharacterized protein C5L36_0C06685 [Pichia kudriavzevii]AWU76748.1 hypothetical protein C5L36_0C06685 [Pichia kudriavzevii]
MTRKVALILKDHTPPETYCKHEQKDSESKIPSPKPLDFHNRPPVHHHKHSHGHRDADEGSGNDHENALDKKLHLPASLPMSHHHSMMCTIPARDSDNGTVFNHKYMRDHTFVPDHDTEGYRRTSLDDTDTPNHQRKGSVPMIGSLVYYKRKSRDAEDGNGPLYSNTEDIKDTSNNPDTTTTSTTTTNNTITTTTNTTVTNTSDNINNYIFHPMGHVSSEVLLDSDVCTDAEIETEIETDTDTDTDSIVLSRSVNSYHRRPSPGNLRRHFSTPTVTQAFARSQYDEFGMINSRIRSQLNPKTKKMNKFLHDQTLKNHLVTSNYHIPGFDPDPTPPTPSINTSPQDSISQSNSTDSNNNNGHRRHSRRLTCAMIFTSPKVVEL